MILTGWLRTFIALAIGIGVSSSICADEAGQRLCVLPVSRHIASWQSDAGGGDISDMAQAFVVTGRDDAKEMLRVRTVDVSGMISDRDVVSVDDALEFYSVRAKQHPSEWLDGLVLSALAYLEIDQPEAALKCCSLALLVAPWDLQALQCRASAHRKLGNDGRTIADRHVAARQAPDNWRCLTYLAHSLANAELAHEGVEIARRAVSLSHSHPVACMTLGQTLCASGQSEAAISEFNRAVAQPSRSPVALLNRATMHLRETQLIEAEKDFSRAIELDPHCAAAYSGRAYCRRANQNDDGALDDLAKALELRFCRADGVAVTGGGIVRLKSNEHLIPIQFDDLKPVVGVLYLMSEIYQDRQQFQLARDALIRAMDIAPQHPAPYVLCSRLLMHCPDESQRDETFALQCAAKACLVTDWTSPEIISNLAMVSYRTGDIEAAIRWQEMAVARSSPDSRTFEACIAFLNHLRDQREEE